MSSVLRITILAVIGVALFFIGLAVGLVSDSDVRDPYPVPAAVPSAPVPVGPRIVRVPFVVPHPVPVPAPFAIADERIGAYRVNGYVTFLGPMRFSTHRQPMACFPLGG